jgi:hypothetical protein
VIETKSSLKIGGERRAVTECCHRAGPIADREGEAPAEPADARCLELRPEAIVTRAGVPRVGVKEGGFESIGRATLRPASTPSNKTGWQ